MEKVMLVFDKPECCDNCPALSRNSEQENYCGGTWNHILKGFKRCEEKRGPNCPLRPLPDKLETLLFNSEQIIGNMQKEDAPVYITGYQKGWNDCLNRIQEEE